jgi:hypothetical protein
MSEGNKRSPSRSDRPPEDLKKERDAFIQQFFRKGAQFTEELLREAERLREHLGELEADNARLRAHLASDEAIRDLLRKIEELERDKEALIQRSAHLSQASDVYSHRYTEVEGELANLANLYVATTQLHAAHSVRNVLRNLKELLSQLLGAASFAVYMVSDDETELCCLASEGVAPAEVARLPVASGAGDVGAAFTKGEIAWLEGADFSRASRDRPAALIPMWLDGRRYGIIVIWKTLPQKTGFSPADSEMFKLLGEQAAPALVHARLFTDAGRRSPSVQTFLDLED